MNNSAFFKSVEFGPESFYYSATIHHNLNLQDPCALVVQVYETHSDGTARSIQVWIQPLDGNSVKISLDRMFGVGDISVAIQGCGYKAAD
jgi:hypothetical protein